MVCECMHVHTQVWDGGGCVPAHSVYIHVYVLYYVLHAKSQLTLETQFPKALHDTS